MLYRSVFNRGKVQRLAIALLVSFSVTPLLRGQEENGSAPPPHVQLGPPWLIHFDDVGTSVILVPYSVHNPTDTTSWTVIYPNGVTIAVTPDFYDTTVEMYILGRGWLVVDMGSGQGTIWRPYYNVWAPPYFVDGDHGGPPLSSGTVDWTLPSPVTLR